MATLDKKYDCIRPECHFDYKVFEYYINSDSNPELLFEQKEETYDYFEDWGKWQHMDDSYRPPVSLEDVDNERIPPPNLLTKKFNSYGFRYSSDIGIGSPENVWYSHTDLDLDQMKIIKEEIRDPLVYMIIEAKEVEDVYKQCRAYKRAVEDEIITEDQIPQIPTPSGFTYDCEYVDCETVKDLINGIPLECKLIEEVLGEEYTGCDLSKYWWYGWLPAQWLNQKSTNINDRVPLGGNTAGAPTTFEEPEAAGPPYQSIIGLYDCPVESEDEENKIVENPNPLGSYYGAFGGFTADPCGCINEPKSFQPDYIEECKFPTVGPKYTEYLEYVRSVGARYWNTPLKSPLLRNAQMKLLFNQQIEFQASGYSDLYVGDVIELVFPPTAMTEDENVESNTTNGKWLIVKIFHSFDKSLRHTSSITCVRDSSPSA
jgi:hypothetical protein